jgi:hypothetical protein
MLSSPAQSVPARVESQFDADETHIATLTGLLESGFGLTDRRLFAWRSNGVSVPLPLVAVERILIDAGPDSPHVDLVVLPRQAVHMPLVLRLRAKDLAVARDFIDQVGQALGSDPRRDDAASVVCLSFAPAGAVTTAP